MFGTRHRSVRNPIDHDPGPNGLKNRLD